MTTRALFNMSLSTVMLGGTAALALCGSIAGASGRDTRAAEKVARARADEAGKALLKGQPDDAVRAAEAAVTMQPRMVDYRVLLGRSYLKAGRFASARAAFADALTLEPANGKAALNLALADTGLGDWARARDVLAAHVDSIPAADRGLATALAGDPIGAVDLLTTAVRSPDATVKTRQNLALAMALAGRWPEARTIAAMDLSPADLDARLEQWAAFARPAGAADQVAALLGVTPVADAGEPVALALNAPDPAPRVAEAVSAPAVTPVSSPAPIVAAAAVAAPIVFAAASPVVQPLPATPIVATDRSEGPTSYKIAVKAALARYVSRAKGHWFVQIGAYRDAGVARADWARAIRRDAAFRAFAPEGVAFQAHGAQLYRLSVGGFARSDADGMCLVFRTKGGHCFVRPGAGEQIASWARKSVQVASR